MENTYNINGTDYWIEEFDPGWGWSCEGDQSEGFFDTYNEALQACMDYVSQQVTNEIDAQEEAENDRIYGSYEDQVRKTYNSMIRS